MIEPDGTVHRGSRSVLFVLHGLGWRLTANLFWHPPLHWLAELGYRIFANNRRFFGRFVFWAPHPDVADF